MNVSLVMITSSGEMKEVPLKGFPAVVGRSDESALRVPVGSVSRRHCELTEDDDELLIRDLGSSNGTFVNREKVTQKELVPGDLIAVGPIVLVVRIDGHPKTIDPVLSFAQGAVESAAGGASAAPTAPTVAVNPKAAPPTAAKPPAKPRTPEEEEEARFQRLMRGNPDDSDDFEIDLSDKPKKR